MLVSLPYKSEAIADHNQACPTSAINRHPRRSIAEHRQREKNSLDAEGSGDNGMAVSPVGR